MASQPTAGLHTEPGRESAANLVGRLVDDVTALVRNEIALGRAELRESLLSARKALDALALGAALWLAGALALVAAAILALSKSLEPWLAATIVGAALALIGYLVMRAARKKLAPSALKPERTREAIRRDVQVVARRAS
jgi:hypothetical protein